MNYRLHILKIQRGFDSKMVCESRQCRGIYWQCLYLFLFLLLNSAVNSVFAATLYVNPNGINCPGTDGPDVYCSIRAAIGAAGPSDIIYLAPGTYKESLNIVNTTSRSLTIIGSGISHTIIDSYSRAFLLKEDVTIKHLTMDVVGPPTGGSGGGILVQGGNFLVNIEDAVIKNGKASRGGGIDIQSGTVNLLRVAIVNNTATIDPQNPNDPIPVGGGVYVAANAGLVAIDSVISGNFAHTNQYGGGYGAGIYNQGTTTLVNTTVSGNVADSPDQRGGGITNGDSSNSAELNLYNSTISKNSANIGGGGVYNFNGTVNVRNSIIAGNTVNAVTGTAPNCSANSSPGFNSQGYNIIGSSGGCDDTIFPPGTNDSKDVTADQLNLLPMPITDPVDNSPFDNIPVFLVEGLNTNSNAIDKVGVNSCLEQNNNSLIHDQRGITRPFDGNSDNTSLCDTGAIELADEIIVYPTELVTFEDQGTGRFYVALAKQPAPTQTVQLGINSQMPAEGAIAPPTTITFDANDWNTPKAVQVNVQNDGLADGNQTYAIDVSANGYQSKVVTVTNIDTVIPPGLVVDVASINVREGGPSQILKVKLATLPAAGSIVNIEIGNNRGIGLDPQETIAPSSLQFNDTNWNVYQDVTVSAVDDTVVDGTFTYNLVVSVAADSTDNTYLGKEVNIPISVTDNDQAAGTPGITLINADNLITTEGGQVEFGAVLQSMPSADVTLNFVSNAPDEGLFSNNQQSYEITFTPQDWDQQQTVTVVGVDDIFADGPQLYTIRVEISSADTAYRGLTVNPQQVINNDNDTADIVVTPGTLITDESGGSATFQVSLSTPPDPSTMVTLAANVQPPGTGQPLEGTVTLPSSQLVFNSDNYNLPQTVTVIGLDDCIADGNKNYAITVTYNTAGTTSGPYANPNIQKTVSVTNTDNESNTPQIVLSKTQLHTSENQTLDTFDICLTTQPSQPVTITMTIPTDGIGEGVFSGGLTSQEIIFDQSNWSEVQTITVAGLDDSSADGDQTYTIEVFSAVSLDPAYANMALPSISVINTDNDVAPGLIVTKSQPQLKTSEAGKSDSFTISLTNQPTAYVTVEVTVQDQTEGKISGPVEYRFKKSLSFAPFEWNRIETILIVGLDDSEDDGDIPYDIVLTIAENSAEEYRSIDPVHIQVVNEDDDVVDPIDSAGGGHTHPGLLCLLIGMAVIRYRCRILQPILSA